MYVVVNVVYSLDLSTVYGFKWSIYQYLTQRRSVPENCFNTFSKYNMKKHMLVHVPFHVYIVIYSKIKIEIDTNNDELLETIREHIINVREIKWGRHTV